MDARGVREGRTVAPFFTAGLEGFNVDDEDDWERAQGLVDAGAVSLPKVDPPWPPYPPPE